MSAKLKNSLEKIGLGILYYQGFVNEHIDDASFPQLSDSMDIPQYSIHMDTYLYNGLMPVNLYMQEISYFIFLL